MSSALPGAPGHDWLNLKDRVCVVTGAAGGIGREICRQLLACGARVAMVDRDEGVLQQSVAELGAELATDNAALKDAALKAIVADVTDSASLQAAANEVKNLWGPCQLLVNNAAALYADAIMDIKLESWNRLLSVNLTGYLLSAQVFGRQMLGHGRGSMVHIASISASIPQPFSGAYSVSKAGVLMLSRLLAVELGEHGVRSNVVSPALIRTPMSEGFYKDPAVLRRREEIVPAGRISTPADIAQAVLFLASDRAAYISGQEILVDGALTQAWLSLIPRPGFEKADARQV
jgi:NAD(P)-dependent dehydrogenase (short-subunit alcohol dehydrogenase family)